MSGNSMHLGGLFGRRMGAVSAPAVIFDFVNGFYGLGDGKNAPVLQSFSEAISFSRASGGTFFDSTGIMQTAANDTPRLDYGLTPGAQPLGLLIEGQQTNFCAQSSTVGFTGWNLFGGATATENSATAPDGTKTASLLSLATSQGVYGTPINLPVNTPATISIYLRADAPCVTRLALVTDPQSDDLFLQCNLTANWQRFTLTYAPTGATTVNIQLDSSDGASTFYAWGAQIEQQEFPSSYIPTSGVMATRAADVAVAAPTPWINMEAGSLVVSAIQRYSGVGNIIQLDPNTNNNDIRMFFRAAGTAPAWGTDGSWGASVNTGGDVTGDAGFTVGGVYDDSGIIADLNGGSPVIAALPGSPPSTWTRMQIGGGVAGPWNGYLRRIRYWPRALSSAELQAATT